MRRGRLDKSETSDGSDSWDAYGMGRASVGAALEGDTSARAPPPWLMNKHRGLLSERIRHIPKIVRK